jgi:hypothetical protein
VQPALVARIPDWQARPYPSIDEVAAQIAQPLTMLGLETQTTFIAVYHPWLEHRRMLNIGPDEILPEIGESLKQAANTIVDELTLSLEDQGIIAKISADPLWRLPDKKMLRLALYDIERVERGGTSQEVNICQPGQTIYVGPNYERPVDAWAAENAGMQYLQAHRLMDLLTMIPSALADPKTESELP